MLSISSLTISSTSPAPSTPAQKLPNFFIVGAPKCGTTSLYHYLDQHPEIFMSPLKEPHFFATEICTENVAEELRPQVDKDAEELRQYLRGDMKEKRMGGKISDWTDYLRLFHNAREEKARGEASVCYLWSQTAAANIHARLPQAKILMMLRDPSEVAFSLYLQSLGKGLIKGSFRHTIDTCLRMKDKQFSLWYPFLELASYAEQVQRFLNFFPRRNILICFYERYRQQQYDVLQEIFRFLEVDDRFLPDTSRRHLEPRIPRFVDLTYVLKKSGIWQRARNWAPQPLRSSLRDVIYRPRASVAMSARDRDFLSGYYREDVKKLSALLDRDLAAWMS